MNEFAASLGLFSVTFFWSIQYIFYYNLPADISSFAFLTLTNGIGFFVTLLAFPKKLLRFTKKQILHCFGLGALLFVFNLFLLTGARMVDAVSTSFIASAYIIFIPIALLLQRKVVPRTQLYAILITLVGVYFGTGADLLHLVQPGVFYLLIADFLFAIYVLLVEKVTKDDDAVVLSMGQMVFVSLFSLITWFFVQPSSMLNLPGDINFWISVFVIAVLVRSYSTIMQIQAQRYVTAIKTSIIFSTQIVFTVITATFLPAFIGGVCQSITLPKLFGCFLVILGVVVSNGLFHFKKSEKTTLL